MRLVLKEKKFIEEVQPVKQPAKQIKFKQSFSPTVEATLNPITLSKKLEENKEQTLEIPELEEKLKEVKPSEVAQQYSQPAFIALTNALVSQFRVWFFGPRVTQGGIIAYKQFQQLARIYASTTNNPQERAALLREALRGALAILFTSYNEGYKKNNPKYNSSTAYQEITERFVRKLL